MPAMPDGQGRRRALIIATATYADTTLAALRAPGRDAVALGGVLEDAAIGGFEVESLLDAPADVLRRRVAGFCAQGSPRDLLLLYMSCHGVLDDRGRLYYATADTDRELLAATAIPSAWINEQLEDCRSRRQIVVLDCCHSGAFAKGAKGDGALALGERFEGRGRVVLTASRATEYSFEGDRVVGDGASSVFTGALVHGLHSGDADRDRDGRITISELYEYVFDAVRTADARQTPMLWTYGAEGDLLVARNARGAEPLPEELVALLESARPRLRESAVAELAELLHGSHPGRAQTARATLERVATEDIPQVAALARQALDGGAPAPPADRPSAPGGGSRPPNERPSWPTASRRRIGAIAVAVVALLAIGVWAMLPGGDAAVEDRPIGDLSGPSGLSIGTGGVWVARRGAREISVLAADGPSRKQSPAPLDGPVGRVAEGLGAAWASGETGSWIVPIDPKSLRGRDLVDLGLPKDPCGCPDPDLVIAAGTLWAGDRPNGRILARDLNDGSEVGRVEMPDGFEGWFAVGRPTEIWAIASVPHGAKTGASFVWLPTAEPDRRRVFALDGDANPVDIAYGEGQDAVWLLDRTDERSRVLRYPGAIRQDERDPDDSAASEPPSEQPEVIDLPAGFRADRIAVDQDSGTALVLDVENGDLARIGSSSRKAAQPIPVPDFPKDRSSDDRHFSDLVASGGVAYVSDPTAGVVHRLRY
jgi:hypothetical protein